ncbi:MAG: 3-phosphoserine/phosphohydroxythreonine transaminase [Clostridia bacterium]|nr:3-phosphoserine/phosphohydroxythreonine transaminase [Clostridia bacterium]
MGEWNRVFNFAAGPAVMPESALLTARDEMLNWRGRGMSVMEMTHRSKMYLEIFDHTVSLFRELLHVPDEYAVLLLQGGATGQFAAIPMNLMTGSGRADYIDSGNFAHGAAAEAEKYGKVSIVASSRDDNYTHIPAWNESAFDKSADYFYITTNNTIFGTRYAQLPETGSVPLVADASSNILSEEMDIRRFGVLYAGAQKNIGPAGLTVVIVRRDLLGRPMPITPKIMNWTVMAEKDSMLNTPPTYAIYMAGLCLEWLKEKGGVAAIEKHNIEKASWLYDYLDESKVFRPTADKPSRSRMNVTFRTASDETDAAFVSYAQQRGLVNLKGHRLTGGLRASIYNAMPPEGVKKLVEVMKSFECSGQEA